MSSNRRRKKDKGKEDDFDLIKKVIDSNLISRKEIEELASIDHPLFSFKYLQEHSVSNCRDVDFFKDFIFRLKKLSELGWTEIRKSDRHSFGMEKIPYYKIKPKSQLPEFVTPDVEFCAFRATGSNLPFLGIQKGKIFYIVFIETQFGDIYDH